jgi:predicted nucleotidyltransferase
MKRDAAAINAKKQQAEKDLLNQTARYNDIKSLREIDRREIDLLQLQIAENEAVRKDLFENIFDFLLS